MRPRLAWTLAAAGAVMASLLCVALAIAAPFVPTPVAPDHEVRWGESVVTTLAPLPAGTREVELLLVTDDGQRSIRVSPERDAREGVIRWRMPRVSARRARLVLRAGGDAGEWQSEPSSEFTIAAPRSDEAAALRRGASDLGWQWLSAPNENAALRTAGARARLARAFEAPALAPEPPTAAALPLVAARDVHCLRRPAPRRLPSLVALASTPARVPLRI